MPSDEGGPTQQRSRSSSPVGNGMGKTTASFSSSTTGHDSERRSKMGCSDDKEHGEDGDLFVLIKERFADYGLAIDDDTACERLHQYLSGVISSNGDVNACLSWVFDEIQEQIENKILKTQVVSKEVIDNILSQVQSFVRVDHPNQSKEQVKQYEANFVKKFQPKRQTGDSSSSHNVFEIYETPAVLLVTIVSGIGLPPINDGKTCNPKVKVIHGDNKFMTTSKSKTTKPIWNESFTCVYSPGKDLILSVYNEVPYSRNTLIGDINIPLRLDGARKLQFSGWNDINQRKAWSLLDIGRTIVTEAKYGHLGQIFVAVSVVLGEAKGHVYVNYCTGLTRALHQGDDPFSSTKVNDDDDGNGDSRENYVYMDESIAEDDPKSTTIDPMEMMDNLKISVGNDLLELDIRGEDDDDDDDDENNDSDVEADHLKVEDICGDVSEHNSGGHELMVSGNCDETSLNKDVQGNAYRSIQSGQAPPASPSKICRRQSLLVNETLVETDQEVQGCKFVRENKEFVDSKLEINETYWQQLEQKGFESSINPTYSAVKVAVRIRLADSDEMSKPIVKICNENEILVEHTSSNSMSHQYAFDQCFDSNDPNEGKGEQTDVYEALGVDMLHHAWSGYNACLFAYGQTGSGKSYSIMGTKEEPGIIPRLADSLFYFIANHAHGCQYTVHSSFLEIYNEAVRDLLDRTRTANLKVREHPETGVFVEGLSVFRVKNFSDINTLLQVGLKERVTGATGMNEESSRSHAIFSITVKCENPETQNTRVSKISIVDLAGSERVGTSKSSGQRLQEGAAINKSLSTLGRCIMQISALSARASSRRQSLGTSSKHIRVPFRDSVLTWMLKESLSGNSKTTMLATISPSHSNYAETLSTLRYAASASQIKTKAVVNEDPTAKLIASLNKEVQELRSLLKKSQSSNMSADSTVSVERVKMETESKTRVKTNDKHGVEKIKDGWIYRTRLRTFSILKHIGDYANATSGLPYLISMQDYADGNDEIDDDLNGNLDGNSENVVAASAMKRSKKLRCKYKFILPEGLSMKIGNDRHQMDKNEIDIQLSGGLDDIYPVHCSVTYENDFNGSKKIFLKKENENATLFVNGVAVMSSMDRVMNVVEIKRHDVIGLGRFHNFIVY